MNTKNCRSLDFSNPDWRLEPKFIANALLASPLVPTEINLNSLAQPTALMFQVLLAAKKSYARENVTLAFSEPPAGFTRAAKVLGLETFFATEVV